MQWFFFIFTPFYIVEENVDRMSSAPSVTSEAAFPLVSCKIKAKFLKQTEEVKSFFSFLGHLMADPRCLSALHRKTL